MDPKCDKKTTSFTWSVTLSESEQNAIEAWYFEQDSEGEYVADTRKLLLGCKSKGGGKTKCRYKLGYYEDYVSRGLSTPW